MKPFSSLSKRRVIAVDLDGTLVHTDLLLENFFLFFRLYPLRVLEVLWWLLFGRAHLKRRLASTVLPDVTGLPYNHELIDWLRCQRADGAWIVLATASDVRIAERVAEHLGIFDEVMGTDGVNLSSTQKKDALVQRFGERGYEYVGDSLADVPVWASASVTHIANPGLGVLSSAARVGLVGEFFQRDRPYLPVLFNALRVHHWTKNLLVFVPLAASHRLLEAQLFFSGCLAFVAFGLCASGVYLINDLLDLPDDRSHPTKRDRPLAAGHLPLLHALLLLPALLCTALGIAIWLLPVAFAWELAGYFFLTLFYSLWLKRVVMLDVVVLAVLYTARVVAGSVAMGLVTTFWILAFCMFIFLSLALIKRYTELRGARLSDRNETPSGRSYYLDDSDLLASLGACSGYISVLVLALYINDSATGTLYRSPQWMWAACPLLLFWLSRAWLIAHRGQMHHDPIVFALRDTVSRWIGLLFVGVFALASF